MKKGKIKQAVSILSLLTTVGGGICASTIPLAMPASVSAATKQGWDGDYYYDNGYVLKGLQKIDDTYYLFDKKTGKYTGESGKQVYLGSFFKDNKTIQGQMFFTLDGEHLHYIDTGTFYGRDMSFIYKNGNFYGTRTKGAGRTYGFYVQDSSNLKTFNRSSVTNLDFDINGYEGLWAPEWLVDYTGNTTGDYVYYCAQDKNDIIRTDANGDPVYRWKIYRAKTKALPTSFDKPEACTFDDFDSTIANTSSNTMIDPAVIKTKDGYIMAVKWGGGGSRSEHTDIYKSTNGLNWNKVTRVSMFDGGPITETMTALNGTVLDSSNSTVGFEGGTLTYINGTYYLYIDHYIWNATDGNEAYTDDTNTTNGMSYDGKMHIATSTDLKNWTYKGTLDAEDHLLRHGSINPISDEAVSKIMNIYNPLVVKFNNNGADNPDWQKGAITVGAESNDSLQNSLFWYKKGYIFSSWNTEPDGSGTKYTFRYEDPNKYTRSDFEEANTELYAQYTPAYTRIRYDKNGGTGAGYTDEFITIDKNYTLKANNLTKEGYVFDGYEVNGQKYKVGDKITEYNATMEPEEVLMYDSGLEDGKWYNQGVTVFKKNGKKYVLASYCATQTNSTDRSLNRIWLVIYDFDTREIVRKRLCSNTDTGFNLGHCNGLCWNSDDEYFMTTTQVKLDFNLNKIDNAPVAQLKHADGSGYALSGIAYRDEKFYAVSGKWLGIFDRSGNLIKEYDTTGCVPEDFNVNQFFNGQDLGVGEDYLYMQMFVGSACNTYITVKPKSDPTKTYFFNYLSGNLSKVAQRKEVQDMYYDDDVDKTYFFANPSSGATADGNTYRMVHDGDAIPTTTVKVLWKAVQKANVKFVDNKGNTLADTLNFEGTYGENVPMTQVQSTINSLKNDGYDTTYTVTEVPFDDDATKDQNIVITFTEHVETISSPKTEGSKTDRANVTYPKSLAKSDLSQTLTRKINYVDENSEVLADSVTQSVERNRAAQFNYVTGAVTYADWSSAQFDAVISPTIKNYKTDKTTVPAVNATKNLTENVVYTKLIQKANIAFKDNTGKTITDTLHFEGVNGESIPTEQIQSTVNALIGNGYDTNYTVKPIPYDDDEGKDQNITIVFTEHVETVSSPKTAGSSTGRDNVTYPEGLSKDDLSQTFNRTIYYKDTNGTNLLDPTTQSATRTRTATFNYVTGEVKYNNWSKAKFDEVTAPEVRNYTYDKSVIPAVADTTKNISEQITYSKIPQKGSVAFTDGNTDIAPKVTLNGYNEEKIKYSPLSTIKSLENKGWDVVENNFPENPVYDTDSNKDQDYTIKFTTHIETITPDNHKEEGDSTGRSIKYPAGLDKNDLNKTISRTIKYVDKDGNEMSSSVVQKTTLTRSADFNYVTGDINYSDWTTDIFDEVTSPEIEDYTREIAKVDSKTVTNKDNSETITVLYSKIPQRAIISFMYGDTEIIEPVVLNGYNKEDFDFNPKEIIESLKAKGYDFVDTDYIYNGTFDTDTETDQKFTVNMTPHIEKVTEAKEEGEDTDREEVKYPAGLSKEDLEKTLTRTIYYKFEDGTEAINPLVQEVTVKRDAYVNFVSGEVDYGDYSEVPFEEITVPELEGYTTDIEIIASSTDTDDITVTYKATPKEEEKTEDNSTSNPTSKEITDETTNESTDDTTDKIKIADEVSSPDTGDKRSDIFILSGIVAGITAVAMGLNIRKKKKRR